MSGFRKLENVWNYFELNFVCPSCNSKVKRSDPSFKEHKMQFDQVSVRGDAHFLRNDQKTSKKCQFCECYRQTELFYHQRKPNARRWASEIEKKTSGSFCPSMHTFRTLWTKLRIFHKSFTVWNYFVGWLSEANCPILLQPCSILRVTITIIFPTIPNIRNLEFKKLILEYFFLEETISGLNADRFNTWKTLLNSVFKLQHHVLPFATFPNFRNWRSFIQALSKFDSSLWHTPLQLISWTVPGDVVSW